MTRRPTPSRSELIQASEPGALDGFGLVCSLCTERHGIRFVGSSSLEVLARQELNAHGAWHAGRGDQ